MNAVASTSSILGRGLYTLPEVARLTGLRAARVREWFRGRADGSRRRRPILRGDYEPVGGDVAVSFHDLIDTFVVGQLREHGVPMPTVRRVYRKLQANLGEPHPFCHQQLLTHGKTVLMSGLDEAGREQITEVLTGQGVFPAIIRPFLQSIEYDAAALARRWQIAERVVIDPGLQFGKPVVTGTGIATAVLAESYRANGRDAELVADWYNVAPDDVRAAAAFESRKAA